MKRCGTIDSVGSNRRPFIRTGIEVVITALTRKVADLVTHENAKARVFFDFSAQVLALGA